MENWATASDPRIAKLIAGMKARGAHYPGDNFYGLVHETAHGEDLGVPDANRVAIHDALMLRTEHERLQAEVVAVATTRRVSAYFGAPFWSPDELVDDFVAETLRLHNSARVRAVTANTLDILNAILDR